MKHSERLARSARSLHATVGELRGALAGRDEEALAYARDSLARLAAAALDPSRPLGFEQAAPAPGAGGPVDDEVLAGALHDLALSEALLSADRALKTGDIVPLDLAAARVGQAAGLLESRAKEPAEHGFSAPVVRSPDLATAVAAVRERAGGCLDSIAERSAGVAWDSLTSIPFAGSLVEGARQLGDRIGIGPVQGQFATLAVKALERALAGLGRLLPAEAVERARQAVAEFGAGLEREVKATVLLMGRVLRCEPTKTDLGRRLDQAGETAGGPDVVERLDRAAGELVELETRFRKRMDQIAGLIALCGAVLGGLAVALAAPVVAGLATAAGALLLAVCVVLAADYADAWPLTTGVRGVRLIVEAAT
ncbi:hypothetical protein ACIBG7_21680 [Nonomuraea sp. NPDC050328]|uniref:hypothetical protein n=1 Tax=Nonomuraea sp. NPDC050328 TaxID=3364361 RepID=UPI0037892D3E